MSRGGADVDAIAPTRVAAPGRALAMKLLGYAFAIIFILLGWEVTAIVLQSPALPTPVETFAVLGRYIVDLVPDFRVSTYRLLAGMACAVIPAVPIALACSRSRYLDPLFAPVLYLLYPVPKVVLLPILLVLLGLADAPKIVLIAITVFFQVLVAVRDAAKSVPENLVLFARSLGAGRIDVLNHIILPATIPAVFTSLRIGTGTAIAVLFFAEAIAGSTGLGYFIMESWALINYPRMFAGIIVLAFLGVLLYAVIDIIERRMTRWR